MYLSGGEGGVSYFSLSSFEHCVLDGWAIKDNDILGLKWSEFGGQIHSKAPGGPQKLNLNKTKGYL